MTISTRKITAFQKLIANLADHPNLGSSALLKQYFDGSPEELRVALNGLIDDLISTTSGASGADQIGSATITGVTGNTVYAQLLDLKAQLSNIILGQIPDGSITTLKIADLNVTTAKIADGAITAAKVAADVATQAELDAVSAIVTTNTADIAKYAVASNLYNYRNQGGF